MSGGLDVAVNLLWVAPDRVGGSEEYLTRQLAGLDDDGTVTPTIYCQPPFVDAHPELTSRFRTVAVPIRQDWRGVRIMAEHTWLVVKSRGADVVHHGGGTAPLVGPGRVVLTVHDLQYLDLPWHFSRSRRTYLATMMPLSIRRAAVVATPSEFVRQTVLEAFRIDPARVVVVTHGVPEPTHPGPDAIHDVLRRYGVLDRQFVVYPAITHPHKGHRVLIEMIRHLPEPMTVVLLGGRGASESGVLDAIGASKNPRRIVRAGRVPAADRDALLAAAAALVFPSEYEGFGAPLVEAMAHGTPVVASSAAAVREVVGDAGVIVDDSSGPAWADAVVRAIGRRDDLIARGHRRREQFTLAESGRALASAYRLAADQ